MRSKRPTYLCGKYWSIGSAQKVRKDCHCCGVGCPGVVKAFKEVKRGQNSLIEQLCRDLNGAHNEILKLQGCPSAEWQNQDWPEWTPQANSIRAAEKLLGKKLAKTDLWTLFPSKPSAPAGEKGGE